MNQPLRLRNRNQFTLVLLGSISIFYLLFDFVVCALPSRWGWDLQYSVHRGLGRVSVNSAFFMISAISAVMAGLYLNDRIRRGFKNSLSASIFVLPLTIGLVIEISFKGIETLLGHLSRELLHGGILTFWLMSLYLIRVIRLKLQGKSIWDGTFGD